MEEMVLVRRSIQGSYCNAYWKRSEMDDCQEQRQSPQSGIFVVKKRTLA